MLPTETDVIILLVEEGYKLHTKKMSSEFPETAIVYYTRNWNSRPKKLRQIRHCQICQSHLCHCEIKFSGFANHFVICFFVLAGTINSLGFSQKKELNYKLYFQLNSTNIDKFLLLRT